MDTGECYSIVGLAGLMGSYTREWRASAEYVLIQGDDIMVVNGQMSKGKPAIEVYTPTIDGDAMLPFATELVQEGKSFVSTSGRSDKTLTVEWTRHFPAKNAEEVVRLVRKGNWPIVFDGKYTIIKEAIGGKPKPDIETGADSPSISDLRPMVDRMIEEGVPFVISLGTDDLVSLERWSMNGAAGKPTT